jgi:uncharacterized protein YcfL
MDLSTTMSSQQQQPTAHTPSCFWLANQALSVNILTNARQHLIQHQESKCISAPARHTQLKV